MSVAYVTNGDCHRCGSSRGPLSVLDDGRLLCAECEADRLRAEVEAWRSRFRAIAGEDRPDTAGNHVLSMQREVEALKARLAEAEKRRELLAEYYNPKIADRIRYETVERLQQQLAQERAAREALARNVDRCLSVIGNEDPSATLGAVIGWIEAHRDVEERAERAEKDRDEYQRQSESLKRQHREVVDSLQADAAALRAALEGAQKALGNLVNMSGHASFVLRKHPEPCRNLDFCVMRDADVVKESVNAALRSDTGRVLLERLHDAEKALRFAAYALGKAVTDRTIGWADPGTWRDVETALAEINDTIAALDSAGKEQP